MASIDQPCMTKYGNMSSTRFNLAVIFYALAIGITSLALAWAVYQGNKYFTAASLIMLLILEVYLLIRYASLTNRQLLLFLKSFRLNDSSMTFNKTNKLPFNEIYNEFNRIIDQFRELKLAKESEQQYFEQVIKEVDTGIMAWETQSGEISLMNRSAKEILGIPHLKNLSKLSMLDQTLFNTLNNGEAGTFKTVKLLKGNEVKSINIRSSVIQVQGKELKLVAIQNIRPELEEREAEAWQRLIRVLTHEIVNSVGPIKLVASALLKQFDNSGNLDEPEVLTGKQMLETEEGLRAIHNRILGLSTFVDDYKTITDIKKPVIKPYVAIELVNEILNLLKKSLIPVHVSCKVNVRPADLKIHVDRSMFEQIVINLIKNAIQALEDSDDPRLSINIVSKDGKVHVQIQDNGCGIPFNTLDYIFLPFFTTKDKGSGIGLTLSRELMHAHGGIIRVASKESEGSLVTLVF